jgi:5'-3' exonuclease
MSGKHLLIDGSSLIFRSFYGVPKDAHAPDGRLVNAIRGTLDALARLTRARRPVSIHIGGDADWRPAARVDLIPSYKAHRVAEPIPPELIPQMEPLEQILAAIGLGVVNVPGLEAEDVIASWVASTDDQIEIYSGDRDLFALIHDPDVIVLYPEKGGLAEVDEAEVTKRYAIPGRAYADFAVLRGDPSDGLPGLKGVGPVAAASMIRRHGSIEALVESGELTPAQSEYVVKAIRVVRPQVDASLRMAAMPPSFPANEELLTALSAAFGVKSSVENLLDALKKVL